MLDLQCDLAALRRLDVRSNALFRRQFVALLTQSGHRASLRNAHSAFS